MSQSSKLSGTEAVPQGPPSLVHVTTPVNAAEVAMQRAAAHQAEVQALQRKETAVLTRVCFLEGLLQRLGHPVGHAGSPPLPCLLSSCHYSDTADEASEADTMEVLFPIPGTHDGQRVRLSALGMTETNARLYRHITAIVAERAVRSDIPTSAGTDLSSEHVNQHKILPLSSPCRRPSEPLADSNRLASVPTEKDQRAAVRPSADSHMQSTPRSDASSLTVDRPSTVIQEDFTKPTRGNSLTPPTDEHNELEAQALSIEGTQDDARAAACLSSVPVDSARIPEGGSGVCGASTVCQDESEDFFSTGTTAPLQRIRGGRRKQDDLYRRAELQARSRGPLEFVDADGRRVQREPNATDLLSAITPIMASASDEPHSIIPPTSLGKGRAERQRRGLPPGSCLPQSRAVKHGERRARSPVVHAEEEEEHSLPLPAYTRSRRQREFDYLQYATMNQGVGDGVPPPTSTPPQYWEIVFPGPRDGPLSDMEGSFK